MPSADPLLEPYRLRHLVLRNRVMSTSHEPFYSEDGMPKERYRLYHVEKAKGGIALTMIGGSSIVDRDSPPAFGNLHLYKDEIVPWLRELADAVHEHGCAVMCQITHLGRRSSHYTGDWLPLIWPSPVREASHRCWPKAMEDFDFARVIRAYAAAAERCRAAGLDGIEIEAYGHLLDAFWSPAWNRRDDEWGGSLDNRMRFSLRVVDAIRQAVGPDFIVGIRMVVDEQLEGGLGRAEGLEIARRLFATGKLDFLNVIRGHIDTDAGLAQVIPNMGTPAAPHLAFAGEVKRLLGTHVPVFHAARINDVATARFAVREGLLDMVGMTRAHIADPHIVAKIRRGEEHRIRPCVGAGYCIDRIYGEGEALCIHNPATGREKSLPHVIPLSEGPRQRVVVVGAGPAGLEAARVSAERGHEVIVLEAASDPGGQIRLSMALDRRLELVGIVDWRVGECERLGVEFRYNLLADAEDVRALEPDIVVVATGGLPHTAFLHEGAEYVTTSWDILSGSVKPADQVLLFDDNGAHPGLVTAEVIARAGAQLEYVTPERMFAPLVGGTNYPAYVDAFTRYGVRVTLFERLVRVRRQGNKLEAELWNEFARRHSTRLVDQVVVEYGTLPNDSLYFALKAESINGGEVDYAALLAGRPQRVVRNPEGRFRLYRIGDAVASRNIHAAILDALRLCMAF
ncbi:putative N-methylproline demethylase [bacterium HR40]|nr:putative N-methylproline demethylase [bacterium HR40]